MAKNVVTKTLIVGSSWTCPAGVSKILELRNFIDYSLGTRISAAEHCVALNESDVAYAWGIGTNGRLGDGTTVSKSSPVVVVGSLKFKQIFSGGSQSAGLTESGDAYTWGLNTNGELGDGTSGAANSKSSPVLVVGGLKWKELAVSSGAGNGFFLGLTDSGDAYAWGVNGSGQLGDGTILKKSSPVLVAGGLKFKKIAAGTNCSFGITLNGDLYSWGNNTNGHLADGVSTNDRSSPVLVVGGLKWKELAASNAIVGLTTSGVAYSWGRNNLGSLGNGVATVPESSPVLVVGGLTFKKVYTGKNEDFCGGITESGDAYTWGENTNSGPLGDGTSGAANSKSSPVLVVGGLKWKELALGRDNCVGLTTSGLLYSWGINTGGQLGDGTILPKSSPVLVVGSIPGNIFDQAFKTSLSNLSVTPGTTYTVSVVGSFVYFGPYCVGKNVGYDIEISYLG